MDVSQINSLVTIDVQGLKSINNIKFGPNPNLETLILEDTSIAKLDFKNVKICKPTIENHDGYLVENCRIFRSIELRNHSRSFILVLSPSILSDLNVRV